MYFVYIVEISSLRCHWQISRLPVWKPIHCVHWQQSPHICADQRQARCYGSSLGCLLFQVQLWYHVQNWSIQPRCRCPVSYQLAPKASGSGFRLSGDGMCQQVTSNSSMVDLYAFDDTVLPDEWDTSPLDHAIDWQQEQANDSCIAQVTQRLENGTPWPKGPGRSQELWTLVKERYRLTVRNGLLYRVRSVRDSDSPEIEHQLVIPSLALKSILEQVHDRSGHMGQDRTMGLLRPRCYWSWM